MDYLSARARSLTQSIEVNWIRISDRGSIASQFIKGTDE